MNCPYLRLLRCCQGVLCAGGGGEHDGGERHFTCLPDFSRHVLELAEKPIRELHRHQARVPCPHAPLNCEAPPFGHHQVAAAVGGAVLEAHLGAVRRLSEARLASEMEAQKQEAIQLELARLQVLLPLLGPTLFLVLRCLVLRVRHVLLLAFGRGAPSCNWTVSLFSAA